VNNIQEGACTRLKGTKVPLTQSTPDVLKTTLPPLNQEVMPEIASATSVCDTNEHKGVSVLSHHHWARPTSVPGARDCTNHNRPQPTHHGHSSITLGLQVTAPTLAGSHQSGYSSNGSSNSQVSSYIFWQSQPVPLQLESTDQGPVGPSDSDRGLSYPSPSSEPDQETMPYNPHFSSENQTLLQEEIHTLLEKQAIQKVPTQTKGFYSSIFMVPKKDGGQRPVINLKRLNYHVKSEHFKMESLHTVKSLLQKEDWMTKVDLKDAFFMVPIAKNFHHLLLFKANAESFQFLCLPFGLCTAPRVFTKVLKPAVELLRPIGIRLVIYMDDMLLMANSRHLILEQTYIALFLLENLGFVINNKKSVLTPCQQIEFLGMAVDSQSMVLNYQERRSGRSEPKLDTSWPPQPFKLDL